jgi:hypothetical protein
MRGEVISIAPAAANLNLAAQLMMGSALVVGMFRARRKSLSCATNVFLTSSPPKPDGYRWRLLRRTPVGFVSRRI